MADKNFALIGAGKVGTALAFLLRKKGYILHTVIDCSEDALARAQSILPGGEGLVRPHFTTELADLPTGLDFLLLGVRDDQLAEMVENLTQHQFHTTGTVLIHLSGVLPSDVGADPGGAQAMHCLSMHPLQAVADVESGIARLPSAVWTLEGDMLAVALGQELLDALQVKWLKIDKEDKALYHAAACTVSNYLVTLTQVATGFLTRLGFAPELAQQALLPLIEGTVANLKEKSPTEALTGPIARGDTATVSRHVEALKVQANWLELYRTLGRATLEYAPTPTASRETLIKLLTEEAKQ